MQYLMQFDVGTLLIAPQIIAIIVAIIVVIIQRRASHE